ISPSLRFTLFPYTTLLRSTNNLELAEVEVMAPPPPTSTPTNTFTPTATVSPTPTAISGQADAAVNKAASQSSNYLSTTGASLAAAGDTTANVKSDITTRIR